MKAMKSEVNRVYEAGWRVQEDLLRPNEQLRVYGTTIVIPVERRFGSLDHVQAYCDRVLKIVGCDRPVRVRNRKGDSCAHYEYGVIAINDPEYGKPGWAMREMVVLHELAHHLALGDGHGEKFRSAFVRLVGEVIGAEIGWLLRIRYMDLGLTCP